MINAFRAVDRFAVPKGMGLVEEIQYARTRTELAWTYINRLALNDRNFGLGSAMSFVTVIVTLIFTLYFFRQLVKSRVIY